MVPPSSSAEPEASPPGRSATPAANGAGASSTAPTIPPTTATPGTAAAPGAPSSGAIDGTHPDAQNRPGDADAARFGHATHAPHEGTGGGSPWRVFKHKYYRRVLIAQAISNVGSWTEMFAIQMFVAKATGRLDDQSVLGMAQLLPIMCLGFVGGLTADRVNRRTLLVVTQVLAGAIAMGVAVVAMTNFADPRTAVHWLFLLGLLNGCVMAFNFPAWQVLTPRLVPKGDLTSAITVNGIQFNMARVLGPVIAGFVLARYGPPPLLWFNALTFLMMGMVVLTTPDAPAPPKTGEPIKQQVKEAVAFLFLNRGPRAVFTAQVLLSLLAAPLVRLLSNFVLDVYRLHDSAAEKTGGKLLALQGVGAVAGGLALRYVPSWYPKHHFIPLSVTGLAITICAFALTTSPWAGFVAMLACGWFWIWAFNQSWAAIQVLVPDRLRGRALSLTNVASFGATAVGVVIAGYFGEFLKPRVGGGDTSEGARLATQASILVLSVPLLLAGVWMLIHRVPEVDGMERMPRGSVRKYNLLHAVTAREHWPARKRAEAEVEEPETV